MKILIKPQFNRRILLFLFLSFFGGIAHASYTPLSASAAGWTLSGTNTYITNNVGIGSATPSQKLDVNGTVHVSGNVGIGTTAPEQKLVIVGNEKVTGSATISNWGISGDTIADPSDSSGVALTWYPGLGQAYFNVGPLDYFGLGPGYVFVGNAAGSYMILDSANFSLINSVSGKPIEFSFDGNVPVMQIVSSGNVGIGSASPAGALDVGTGQICLNHVCDSTWPSGAVSSVSNANGTLTISPTTGAVVASLALGHANTWTGQQIFNTANVGIGSATPGQTLDVTGTVRATQFIAGTGGITLGGVNNTSWPSGATTSGTNMLFGNGSGAFTNVTNTAVSGGNIGIGTTTLTSNLLTIGSTGQDVIATNGNLGIGTTSPGEALQVNNTIINSSEVANGTCSGGTTTINWNTGNKQTVTVSGASCTLAFTAPSGVGNFLLRIVQGATPGNPAWPNSTVIKWTGGSAPTLTGTTGAVDIVTFYYNGSYYYGTASLNFS